VELQSIMEQAPNTGIDSPRAWLIVLAAFFGAFVAFGVTYCFGVFLKPLGVAFGANHATMSTVFSTLTVLSFFLAPLTGDLADRIGPRYVVGAGALLMGAGLLLTAQVHSLPMLFLSYGVCVGAAVACVYIPSVAAVGEWFKVRRDIALGIAISGIGCGTLVAAPLAARLTVDIGWRHTFELFGWTSMVILLACAALLSRPPILRAKDTANVWGMMRTRTFVLLYIALVFDGIAIYAAFVFISPFAMDLGATHVAGAALIGYVGASSVVGRLGLNALAPRFGLLNVYKSCYWILLASSMIWAMSHTYPMLVVFALVMGIGYGGIAAMSPAVAAAKFGIEGLGELLGFLFTAFGVACLVGPPLAGVLVDSTHDFRWPAYVAIASSVLALGAVMKLRKDAPLATAQPETATAD
jgi:MFS family permease